MPTYVVHIGPPKAGSTYLQSGLHGVRHQLGRQGVHYQTDWLSPVREINHEWMISALGTIPNVALEQAFERLNRSEYKYVVLSSEGFFGLNSQQLAYVRDMAGGSPFRIVYYCRRWSERIPSQWQQHIKVGRYITFPQHHARELRDPASFLDFNPTLVWQKFAAVFGQESLRLIPFNTLVDRRIDLLDHFVERVLDSRIGARPQRVIANESPSIADTELIRALNYLYFAREGEVSADIYKNFQNRRALLPLEAISPAMDADMAEIVLNDNAQPFRGIYADMLEYRANIVSPLDDGEFFVKKLRRFRFVQQNYLLLDGVVETLRRMFSAVDPARDAAVALAQDGVAAG